MKKSLVLLACFSTSVFANSEVQSNTPLPENAPIMHLSVVDTRNEMMNSVGLSYSLSNKHHRLCWAVFDTALQQQNKVVEVFVSPKTSKFHSTNSTIESSKDKKTHTITTMLAKDGESLSRCWRFDNTDPLGKYALDLRVNDITFPTQTFELVK